MPAILYSLPKIAKNVNTIEYSEGTLERFGGFLRCYYLKAREFFDHVGTESRSKTVERKAKKNARL
jgi:hypothetical protein